MKFGKKSQAVISIFLILTMMPLLGLAVVLVDGSRVRSAEMMVKEASDLAAMSTLAGYDKDLKNDYGLFALKNPNDAGAVFEAYLKSSLTAATGGNKEYSDKMYNAVKEALFGGESKINSFTDLFNYKIGNTSIETLYSLDQKEVLQNQIVEYTKYRGVYFLADRLSLLSKFEEVKKEKEMQKKNTDLIKKKTDFDEDAAKNVEDKITKLNSDIVEFQNAVKEVNNEDTIGNITSLIFKVMDDAEDKYEENLDNNSWDPDTPVAYELASYNNMTTYIPTLAERLEKSAVEAKQKYDKINNGGRINNIIQSIQNEKEKLEKFQKENVDNSDATAAEEMKEDIKDTLKTYDIYCASLASLRDYFNGEAAKNDVKNLEIAATMWTNAHQALKNSLKDEINSPNMLHGNIYENDVETTVATEHMYYGLAESGNKFISDGNYMGNYETIKGVYCGGSAGCPHYSSACQDISNRVCYIGLEETEKEEEAEKKEQKAQNEITKGNNEVEEKKNSFGTKSIPDSEAGILPSIGEMKIDDIQSACSINRSDVKKNTDNILNNGMNMLMNLATATRDEALTYAYAFGMFKSRMSDSSRFCTAKKPSSWENYHVQWRYEHDDGEHDLRERSKASLNTVLDGELEYIFGGKNADKSNAGNVYAAIYAERLANNLIAVYSNKEARKQCLELASVTAAAVAAASFGLIVLSPTVYKWIYITAWAIAETCAEMNYLVESGYRIPLVKTGKELLIKSILYPIATEENLKKIDEVSTINICYEDYLLLLMCVMTNSETRVRRIGDLIQLNMRQRYGGTFLLNQAPTYIKASTGISIDFLFSQVPQFDEFYNGNGITFNNTIYQGY